MPTFLIIETKVGIFILLPVVARRKVDMLEDRERKKKSPLGKITFIYQIFVKCQAFFLVPGIYLNSSNSQISIVIIIPIFQLRKSTCRECESLVDGHKADEWEYTTRPFGARALAPNYSSKLHFPLCYYYGRLGNKNRDPYI